jgi:hypothetical protein
MKDKIGPGEPAIGFSIDCKINDRRAMVIQTYLPIDAAPKQINEVLDRLLVAAERQEVRYRLKDMQIILEKHMEELPLRDKQLAEFENKEVATYQTSGRKSNFEWKGQSKTNRDNLIQSVAMTKVAIERTKKAIAEAEAELKDD